MRSSAAPVFVALASVALHCGQRARSSRDGSDEAPEITGQKPRRPLVSAPSKLPYLEQCVAHAGGSEMHAESGRGAKGSCWFNAECGVPGKPGPNDGFVGIGCSEPGFCTCTIEPLREGAKTVTFEFDVARPCSGELAESLLLRECMKGMSFAKD